VYVRTVAPVAFFIIRVEGARTWYCSKYVELSNVFIVRLKNEERGVYMRVAWATIVLLYSITRVRFVLITYVFTRVLLIEKWVTLAVVLPDMDEGIWFIVTFNDLLSQNVTLYVLTLVFISVIANELELVVIALTDTSRKIDKINNNGITILFTS